MPTQARIAASTPAAVYGLGSPTPPCSGGSPTTCSVRVRISSMSAGLVPTSSAAMYCPPSDSTLSARSSSIASRSTSGSIAITLLPPPSGRPAAADLYVMPRARRSASRTASAALA